MSTTQQQQQDSGIVLGGSENSLAGTGTGGCVGDDRISDLDRQYARVDQAVDEAFKEARNWSSYVRKINNYIESICKHSAELHSKLRQTSDRMREELKSTEWEHMPMRNYYFQGIAKILDDEKNSCEVFTHGMPLVVGSTMRSRCAEHEDRRKKLKDEWNAEEKKWKTARKNMDSAQAKYNQSCIDLERSKADHQNTVDKGNEAQATVDAKAETKHQSKVDRKRQTMEDCEQRRVSCKESYATAVEEANQATQSLEHKKVEILSQLRQLIEQSDSLFTKSTVSFFEYKKSVKEFGLQDFSELSSRIHNEYKPGSKYLEKVNHQVHFPNRKTVAPVTYVFQEYQPSSRLDVPGPSRKQSRPGAGDSPETSGVQMDSDEDEYEESRSSGSSMVKKMWPTKMDAVEVFSGMTSIVKEKAKSIKIYRGSGSAGKVSGSVDTPDYLSTTNVPKKELHTAVAVLLRCMREIEDNGISSDGIYRVQSAKSKVTAVCQAFETADGVSACSIDLSNETPMTLASVLKHYLIQLVEPLLTYDLYQNFVDLGKQCGPQGPNPIVISRLCELCARLPRTNKIMAASLFHHLKRVASHSHENKMDCANLSTVFGPTLLKPRPMSAPTVGVPMTAAMNEMVDHQHQIAIVGALIQHADIAFGAEDSYDLASLAEELCKQAQPTSGLTSGLTSASAAAQHAALSRTQSDSTVATARTQHQVTSTTSSSSEIIVRKESTNSSSGISQPCRRTSSGRDEQQDWISQRASMQQQQIHKQLPQGLGDLGAGGASPTVPPPPAPKAFDPDIDDDFPDMDEELEDAPSGHFANRQPAGTAAHRAVAPTHSHPGGRLITTFRVQGSPCASPGATQGPLSAPPIGINQPITRPLFGQQARQSSAPLGMSQTAPLARTADSSLSSDTSNTQQQRATANLQVGSQSGRGAISPSQRRAFFFSQTSPYQAAER